MQSVTRSFRRWRLKDRDFQREADLYQLHLLLSYRAVKLAKEGGKNFPSAVEILSGSVDEILDRTDRLSPKVREQECTKLVDAQVKRCFLGLASQVQLNFSCFKSSL